MASSVAVAPAHRSRGVCRLLLHDWFREQWDAGCRDFVGALVHRDGRSRLQGWATAQTSIREYEIYEQRL